MKSWQVSRHTVSFEPPWLFCFVMRGDCTAADMARIAEIIFGEAADAPFLFALVDLTELGEVNAEARRAGGLVGSKIPYHGIALIGTNFRAKLLAKLTLTAVRLFPPSSKLQMYFADSEPEARAWIEARARAAAAERPGS